MYIKFHFCFLTKVHFVPEYFADEGINISNRDGLLKVRSEGL